MYIQQRRFLIYKDGATFILDIYNNYIDPSFIPIDPTQGDSNSIDTAHRMKAFLESEGWIQQDAGHGDNNPNLQYWHFSRDITY